MLRGGRKDKANRLELDVEATINEADAASSVSPAKTFSLPAGGFSLTSVNRVLGMIAAVAGLYFVLTLLAGVTKLAGVGHHIRQLEAQGAKLASDPVPAHEAVRAVRVDPALTNRNVFQPAGAAVTSSDAGVSAGSKTSAYRLVGISESKDPAETTVMVENSQTKLTYFLQYGQPVEGLELEKILEDKVIVKIGGNAVELE